MGDENSKQMYTYKSELMQQAEKMVFTTIPQRILALETLCKSEKFSDEALSTPCDINIPYPQAPNGETASTTGKGEVMLFPKGIAPANPEVREMLDAIEPELDKLLDATNLIRLWIVFLMPKVEDGNNLGVEIQEFLLSEVSAVEDETKAKFREIQAYFTARGDLVTKIARYPHCEDYRMALNRKDGNMKRFGLLMLLDVKNSYCSLYEFASKNYHKIKTPRSLFNTNHFN